MDLPGYKLGGSAVSKDAESRIYTGASRLFAALLGAGRVNETNMPGIVRYCVRAAIQLSQECDQALQPQPEPKASDDLDLDLELDELAKPEGTAYRRPAGPPAGGRQGTPV